MWAAAGTGAAHRAQRPAAQCGCGRLLSRVHVAAPVRRLSQLLAGGGDVPKPRPGRRQAGRPPQGRAGALQIVRRAAFRAVPGCPPGPHPVLTRSFRRNRRPLPGRACTRYILNDEGKSPIFKATDGSVTQLRELFQRETSPSALFDGLFSVQAEVLWHRVRPCERDTTLMLGGGLARPWAAFSLPGVFHDGEDVLRTVPRKSNLPADVPRRLGWDQR